MKVPVLAAALLALIAPVSAHAVATISGACSANGSLTQAKCTGTNGAYGNSVTLNATDDASLQVKITAWQANQSSGAITSAFLGAYSSGFGVTGVQDYTIDPANPTVKVWGGGNTHTIDNVNGYTDFVMLQFSREVNLSGFGRSQFLVAGANTADSDASFYSTGLSATSVNQNTAFDISPYPNDALAWTSVNNSTSSFASNGFSSVWLVGASMLTTDRNDGFKLSSIIVTPRLAATPEPSTWLMMIAGFGLVGYSLRRRRTEVALAA